MNDSGVPALLMQAAQSAAQADGLAPPDPQTSGDMGPPPELSPPPSSSSCSSRKVAPGGGSGGGGGGGGGGNSKKKGQALRRGKWTTEEEAYANRLIQEFKAGLLPLTDGTTLRTFLSKLLNCDPMRISKKFVGSNCIGKQVFRRRTADLNRLTPDQIQNSRAELSDLERRFLDRVAQTNRVKNSSSSSGNNNNNSNNGNNGAMAGVNGAGGTNGMATSTAAAAAAMSAGNNGHAVAGLHDTVGMMANGFGGGAGGNSFMAGLGGIGGMDGNNGGAPGMNPMDHLNAMSNPPWMQPPMGYRHGMGAQMAAANLAGGQANSRAAAAGRALLEGFNQGGGGGGGGKNDKNGFGSGMSAANMFAMAEMQRRASQQALGSLTNPSAQDLLAALQNSGSSHSLAQMAQTASAARLGAFGGGANNKSLSNLVLKTDFSRDQLSQMARDRGVSSASLSNMMNERKSSFDALMSLEFQSLQSIDNLANLIQTGGGNGQAPTNGMKNWSAEASGYGGAASSSTGLSNAARHLASAQNLESFMRSMSNANMNSGPSSANLHSLLQGMSNGNLAGAAGASMSSLLASGTGGGNAASAASLANMLRENQSSTGLSALRNQEGFQHRNTSVEDFLGLMAAGDIPHQDASLLNLPLSQLQQQQLQQQQLGDKGTNTAHNGNSSGMLQQQLLAQMASNGSGSLSNLELLQQMAGGQSYPDLKRKFKEGDGAEAQVSSKRQG